jgi:hypothetical protein
LIIHIFLKLDFLLQHNIFVFGGFSLVHSSNFDDLWLFDTITHVWIFIDKAKKPKPLFSAFTGASASGPDHDDGKQIAYPAPGPRGYHSMVISGT